MTLLGGQPGPEPKTSVRHQRQGATLSDNKSIATLKKRYCVLQFLKATIEDQQRVIILEMVEIE